MRVRGTITLAATLALAGCLKPNPLGDKMDEETSDTGSEHGMPENPGSGSGNGDDDTTGDGDGDGDPGDGDPGDGDGDPGDGDGDPGDGDGEPGDGDGDGDGDGEPLPPPDVGGAEGGCGSFDGIETECAACLESECCQLTAACSDVQSCECLVACDLAGEPPGVCKNQCGADPDDIPQLGNLLACVATWCPDAC